MWTSFGNIKKGLVEYYVLKFSLCTHGFMPLKSYLKTGIWYLISEIRFSSIRLVTKPHNEKCQLTEYLDYLDFQM